MISFRLTMDKDDKNDDVQSRYLYVSSSTKGALAQSIFPGSAVRPSKY